MNLRQLELFQAVVEAGSFSRGAEAAHITQSTVSQHLAALEEEFGLKLLDRTKKGVFPTAGGKILYQRAGQLIAQAREIPLAIKRFRGLEEVSVKLGASNIPGTYLGPAAFARFHEKYPGVNFILLQGDSRETVDRLLKGEIEIGVIGTRFDEEGVDFRPLGCEKIVLAVKGTHPWAGGKPLSWKKLRDERFIIREPGSGTEKTVREALAGLGIEPDCLKIHAVLGSNEAVKQAVTLGLGAAFISEMSIRGELGRGELAAVKIRGLSITRSFYLISRPARELSPPSLALAELLAAMYGKRS